MGQYIPHGILDFFCLFDFKTITTTKINLPDTFFSKYYAYLERSCLEYTVEDIVAFYYMQQGYKVKRLYMKRNYAGCPDLKIEKNGITDYIEVKSRKDFIKIHQLKEAFERKSKIIWVLPISENSKDKRNLRGFKEIFKNFQEKQIKATIIGESKQGAGLE